MEFGLSARLRLDSYGRVETLDSSRSTANFSATFSSSSLASSLADSFQMSPTPLLSFLHTSDSDRRHFVETLDSSRSTANFSATFSGSSLASSLADSFQMSPTPLSSFLHTSDSDRRHFVHNPTPDSLASSLPPPHLSRLLYTPPLQCLQHLAGALDPTVVFQVLTAAVLLCCDLWTLLLATPPPSISSLQFKSCTSLPWEGRLSPQRIVAHFAAFALASPFPDLIDSNLWGPDYDCFSKQPP
jgi:hypothetical protein